MNSCRLLAISSALSLPSQTPAENPRESTVKHRTLKRRTVVMGIGATAGVAAAGGIALSAQASSDSSSSGSSASSSDSLVFDPDGYTKLTTTVTDTDGHDHY